jgi:hypothetical protein
MKKEDSIFLTRNADSQMTETPVPKNGDDPTHGMQLRLQCNNADVCKN